MGGQYREELWPATGDGCENYLCPGLHTLICGSEESLYGC
jgi:hypothetical protein